MKEEVIIELKLDRDEGDFAKLAQLKQSLLNIKQEQAQLTKAYKDGAITIKEFASETVRLEANQKKLAAAYTETQRKVTGLKNPFNELKGAIQDQAKQVNIAGLSLATFANPVTATIGVLGGLFKAYASSTIGAKDLENASNQLGSALGFVSNQLAVLVSGGGEGGEGLLSKFAFAMNSALFGFDAATAGAVFAGIQEKLDDLGRDEIRIRSDVSQRLEDNAVIMAKLADSAVDYNEKVHLSSEAIKNLRDNEDDLIKVKEEQLKLLQLALANDTQNEKLQDAVLLKEQEIANIKRDTERKVQGIIKLESNLADTKERQLSADQKQEEIRQKKIKDEEDAKKKKLDDDGLKKEMDRLAMLQQLREENSAEAYKAEWDEKVRIANEANDEIDRRAVKSFEDEKARNIQKIERVRGITKDLTMILATSLTESANFGEQILKSYLIMAVRSLKQFLLVKVIGESFATWDSILTFGLSGAGRAAIMAGLIEGVFAGVESAIAGFANSGRVEGKVKNQGRKIRRSNGDDQLVTVKTGEVVLNERHQRMLGGDDTFRKLGVPGFATSGLVTPQVNTPMIDERLLRVMSKISQRQVAVVIEDVERLIQSRAQIREQATL